MTNQNSIQEEIKSRLKAGNSLLLNPDTFGVNLIGDAIIGIESNADVLLNACREIGLAVNTGKTKYMEIGRAYQDR